MTRHMAMLGQALTSPEAVGGALPAISPVRTTPVAAEYAPLIARLFKGSKPLRVIGFVSALRQEGVTYTTQRVASEIGRITGLRVQVVRPQELLPPVTASQFFGLPQVFSGSRILRSAGPGPVDEAVPGRSDCDVVLVDAGSVLEDGMAVGIASRMDALVMVVEAGRTRKADLVRAIDTLSAARGTVIGFVLNKQKRFLPMWLQRLITSGGTV